MALIPKPRTVIEEATLADASQLAVIHEWSFSRPWSTEEICALIADHPVVKGLVVRSMSWKARRIAGFAIMRTAADEAEILTVAVSPNDRRRGFGRMLIEEAARRAYHDRVASMFLEVDETNHAAVSLYKGLGFETVGQRASYYQKADAPPNTALVMRLRLR